MTETTYLNLLTDRWLHVHLANGEEKQICPADIGRNDLCDLIAPRADFRGALYQMLVGLLQTAFAPANRKEWKRYWETPPDAETLATALEPLKTAFGLDAPLGKPAFMQDLDLVEGEQKPVSALLIDAPGSQGLRNNQDHFIKRGSVEKLSPTMAALALFTLQINAPAGGQGHRVSLRGGGPLTTLILPPEEGPHDTLWHRLWLNVLTEEEFSLLPGDHTNTAPGAIFPWMVPTRTSEKKGMETYPEQVNPLQAYWSMPRRIRLRFEGVSGICDLSGAQSELIVEHFVTKNYGTNYAGSWIHPLTPYSLQEGEEPISIKAQPGGLGYRHWLGLVLPTRQGKAVREPATVVQRYQQRRVWIDDMDFHPRLWAFGYDMDNMKARCWYETEMPVFNLETEQRDDVVDYAQKMIEASAAVLKTLKASLKQAWFKRPGDAKGDFSFVDANFWSATEPDFYALLDELVEALDDEDHIDTLLARWRAILRDQAQSLFDRYALSNFNEDGDLKRVVMARDGKKGLLHFLNRSKAMKALSA